MNTKRAEALVEQGLELLSRITKRVLEESERHVLWNVPSEPLDREVGVTHAENVQSDTHKRFSQVKRCSEK